jgi:hypothetical protein
MKVVSLFCLVLYFFTLGFWAADAEAAAGQEPGVVLVETRRARAQIMVSDQAVPVVKHAAEELQYHIRKATEAELPIVDESKVDGSLTHRIYLGDCAATHAARSSFQGEVDPATEYAENGEVGWGPKTKVGDIFLATSDNKMEVGAVINGYHRDTPKVLEQNWLVFSRERLSQDSVVRTQVVYFRRMIEVGGVRVEPCDLFLGDLDGVVIAPDALFRLVSSVVAGGATKPERLGHREYFIFHKHQDTPGLLQGRPA